MKKIIMVKNAKGSMRLLAPVAIALFACSVFSFAPRLASAQTSSALEFISCTYPSHVAGARTFAIRRAEQIVFTCTIANKSDADVPVLLIGKQTREKSAGAGSAVSSTLVDIPKGQRKEVEVVFPAIFEGGTYDFSFLLRDPASGSPASREISQRGTLGAQAARIISARLDKKEYGPGEPMELTLVTSSTAGTPLEKGSFLFDVDVEDAHWDICASVAADQMVGPMEHTYRLTFPSTATCAASAIRVVLKTKDGIVSDSTHIDISMRERPAFLGGIFTWSLFIVALLYGGIYYFRRGRQQVTDS